MSVYQTQFDIENIQGYLFLVAYVHYYKAGHLKIETDKLKIDIGVLKYVIESNFYGDMLGATRRRLQEGEMPYPGYCRAPGSEVCQPVLCNCDMLSKIWEKRKNLIQERNSH